MGASGEVSSASAWGLLQIADHQGKRLVAPGLACSQPGNGRRVPGVGHQVKAAQSLDGHDLTGAQGIGRAVQGVVPLDDQRPETNDEAPRRRDEGRVTFGQQSTFVLRPSSFVYHRWSCIQSQARPAHGTCIRLSMETPVEGVLILGLAIRAHNEAAHGGVGPVVGQRLDDGETWTAVGAVGERIAIAAVARVEDFGQAVGAGGDVGQHQDRLGAMLLAVPDLKALVAYRV